MTKLVTVQRAKDEIKRLQNFVDLAESYEVKSVESWIIKEYAYTNSIVEVIKRAKDKDFAVEERLIDRDFIVEVINGRASDELHKILRSGYRLKIRPVKKRNKEYISRTFY